MFDDYEYWKYIEPAKYQTAEDFLEKVKEYFQNPEKNLEILSYFSLHFSSSEFFAFTHLNII